MLELLEPFWGLYNYRLDYPYYSNAVYVLLQGFLDKTETTHGRDFDVYPIYCIVMTYANPPEVRAIVDASIHVSEAEQLMMKLAVETKYTLFGAHEHND